MPLRLVLPMLLLIAGPAQAGAAVPAPSVLPQALLAALAIVALATAALLARRLRQARARAAMLQAETARLEAEATRLRATAARAEAQARLLDGAMEAMSDGVAVVDAELRIVSWNPRFPEVSGVPRSALRIGTPFEQAVLLQARAGEFGLVDPEEETARRMRLLREGPATERLRRERPDGSRIELRRASLPGGGFVTLYTPLEEAGSPHDAELSRAFRQEWSARLPRLTAAAADGDTAAARATAHALRGIAANAGWGGAVATLAALEAAATAGDARELRVLAASLVMDEPW